MKPKQAETLKTIIGMKRQKAEQEMLAIQQDVRRIESEIVMCDQRLNELDQISGDYDGISLARRHGNVERLISEKKAHQAARQARLVDLEAAREALKRVLHSEGRIDEL